ncbi:MAG: SNF2-related protein [Chlamydiota bacterium]|nr:SNF2-related protein [Chlamydiota bacterium]
MLFETPEDTYQAYHRFLKKKEFRKAYRCLEKMLHEFPKHVELLEEMIDFCLGSMENPKMAKPWLSQLIQLRSHWRDHLLLSQVEVALDHLKKARIHLDQAQKLLKSETSIQNKSKIRKTLEEQEQILQHFEAVKSRKIGAYLASSQWDPRKDTRRIPSGQTTQTKKKTPFPKKRKTDFLPPKEGSVVKSPEADLKPVEGIKKREIPVYEIPVQFTATYEENFSKFLEERPSSLKECRFLLDYHRLCLQRDFDELLCLQAMTNVEKFWYQIETVKKVLKFFHGRVLLCDEVGLGKTIEAGLLMKEYLLRGMIKNILILTPASLVSQWREEMLSKFGIDFATTHDAEFAENPAHFWQRRFIIASLQTAKHDKHRAVVTEGFFDLVIVDEAHHLRNRNTLAWQLVNQIKKRYLFLLTATPIQNDLIELFNLITLLKPGQFKTERLFKKEYIRRENPRAPLHPEKLRELLREVMIRNTRSVIDLALPKRFATTLRLEPTPLEKEIFTKTYQFLNLRRSTLPKMMIHMLLKEIGSSPYALKKTLLTLKDRDSVNEIVNQIDKIEELSKGKALLEILSKNPDEKKMIFTQYTRSMDYLSDLLTRHELLHVTFRGDHSAHQKNEAIKRFKEDIPILLSTESGGEGRNIQFCNTLINFDLPWNPMRIEQRIGRIHRIGQSRDVFIFNLSIKETIEDYILDILDHKMNMFEMVIGEIEPILGAITEEGDFEEIIFGIWLKSTHPENLKKGFEELGAQLVNAKREYLKTQTLDHQLFSQDYEI